MKKPLGLSDFGLFDDLRLCNGRLHHHFLEEMDMWKDGGDSATICIIMRYHESRARKRNSRH